METLLDLTAGTIGGCTGIIVGQPIDTVKVRLQAMPGAFKGPVDCFFRTWREEGGRALFKGLTSPLVGNAPMNGLVFGGYGYTSRFLDDNLAPLPDGELSYTRISLSAAAAGSVQTVVACPTELVKCKLQVQSTTVQYAGPVDCFRKMVATNGWRRGLFQGFTLTFLRDVPGFAVYFVAYEAVKHALTPSNSEASVPAMLAAGAVAGVLTWGLTYPFDVLKSRVQTVPDSAPASELKMLPVARKLYEEAGWYGFTRGLLTTCVRAAPVNAVTFLVYEESKDWLASRFSVELH